MSERIDQATRIIHAAPSQVYQAFAHQEALESWLPPKGMTGHMLAFDFRDGGYYRMQLIYDDAKGKHGKTSENTDEVLVRILKLIPDQCIQQEVSFEADDQDFSGTMKMTWLFAAVSQGTELTVLCENVPVGISPEDHQAGLDSSLQNLAEFVE